MKRATFFVDAENIRLGLEKALGIQAGTRTPAVFLETASSWNNTAGTVTSTFWAPNTTKGFTLIG